MTIAHLEWTHTGLVWPFLASALILLALLGYASTRRNMPAAGSFSAVALIGAVWALLSALHISVGGLEAKEIFGHARYLAIAAMPVAWIRFALLYTGYGSRLRGRRTWLLCIVPALTILAVATNSLHSLMFSEASLVVSGNAYAVEHEYGPWFWVHTTYSYTLIALGLVAMIVQAMTAAPPFRKQARLVASGVSAAVLANVAFLALPEQFGHVDFTPVAFTLTAVFLTWGLFRLGLLNLSPVARAAVVASMPDAVVVLDSESRIVDLNPAAQDLFGAHIEEAVGRSIFELADSAVETLFPEHGGLDEEVVLRVGDEEHYYEWTMSSLDGRLGDPAGHMMILRDVTERKRYKAELENKEAFLRSIYEAAGQAVVVFEPDAAGDILVVDANPAFTKMVGAADRDELRARPIADLLSGAPKRDVLDHVSACQEHGTAVTREYRQSVNGSDLWWMVTLTPVVEAGDHTPRLVGTVTDISWHRAYERELRRAKEHAEELARQKSSLLADMSHEIRTPLSSIIGYADLLADTVGDEHKHLVQIIGEGGERLLTTLNSVLECARLEAGQVRPDLMTVDVREFATETASFYRPQAQSRHIDLRLRIPSHPVYARLDRAHAVRILNNLIGNALKFTERGSVDLSITADEDRVYIGVHDTGRGISEEFLPHVFKEFSQEKDASGRNENGSGLGLRITQMLVQLMDGQISVESNLGQGTTFTVSFARCDPPLTTDGTTRTRPVRVSASTPGDVEILIVEDNEKMAELMRYQLGDVARTEIVYDGLTALELLEERRFSVILLDISLGGQMTGVDVLRSIKESERHRDVPVVAVTAYNLPGDELRLLREGFDRYLAKPFARDQLIDLVTDLVGTDEHWDVAKKASSGPRSERPARGRDAVRPGMDVPPSPDTTEAR